MLFDLNLKSTPPSEDQVLAARERLPKKRLLFLVTAVVMPFAAVVCEQLLTGLGFSETAGAVAGAVLGLPMFLLLIATLVANAQLQGLLPATPKSCLALEEAVAEPLIARYVQRVRLQGRKLTEMEAYFLLSCWDRRCAAELAVKEKLAAQRLHGPAPGGGLSQLEP